MIVGGRVLKTKVMRPATGNARKVFETPPPPPVEDISWSSAMKKAELVDVAKRKGLEVDESLTKAQLLQMLADYERKNAQSVARYMYFYANAR